MPIVTMPDGTNVEFDDNMPPEQIQGLIASKFPDEVNSLNQPQYEPSIGRTMLDQGLQGSTFGFGDEITNRIGAGIASVATGEPYSNLLQEATDSSKDRLSAQMEQRPVLSIGSNIAGALLTGGAGATTKTGAAIGNTVRRGLLRGQTSTLGRVANYATKMATSGAAGAASGGLYGFGAGEGGIDERTASSKQNAILGSVLGGGAPILSSAVKGASKGVLEKLATPKIIEQANADDIRKLAGNAYKFAEEKGGTLTPQFTNKFLEKVDKVTPQTTAGKLLAGDDPVSKIAEKMKSLKDRELTLAEAQEIDEFLGDQIDNFTELGRVNKQGKKLLDIQTEFRNSIDNAAEGDLIGGKEGFEALKQGRQLWSRAARLRDIEKIITRAEMTDNPASSMKSGFRNLANNPARMRGYSEKERELIKRAAISGLPSELTKLAGSRLNTIIAGSTGGLGAAATAQVVGMGARGLGTKLQASKAQKIASEISSPANKVAEPTKLNRTAQKLLGNK